MKNFADFRRIAVVALAIAIASCTAQLHAFDGVQPTICQKLTTTYCDEKGGDCADRYIDIECYHGICSNLTGECLCSPCWTGEKCDMLENNHVPAFDQEQLSVDINVNKLYTYENNIVATINAKDHDNKKCPTGQDCPCATVLYSIERGNEDAMFMIDPRKGELSLSLRGGDKPPLGRTFNFVVSARNPVHRTRDRRMAVDEYVDSQSTSNIAVIVNFVEEASEAEVVHSRRRRSTDGIPSEETFVLEKLDSWTSVTEVKVADKIPFQLTIWIPQKSITAQVELLTQYESSAIMTICDPQIVHIGGNFGSLSASDVETTMYAHGGDFLYDRAVLDLGTITNDGSDGSDNLASQILITFFAVMEDNNATQYGDDYWVSAGVTYDNGQEIWVGQTSFTAVDDRESWIWKAPVINMNGPDSLSKETATLITIELTLENYAIPAFYVDVVTNNHTTDPIMYIGDLEYADQGGSFGCLPTERAQPTEVYDNATGLLSLARLDFGPIVNTGFRDGENSDTKNSITLTSSVYMTSNSEVVEGETYWFGLAIHMSLEEAVIYSQQIGIIADAVSDADMAESPRFEFYAVDGYNVIIGGGIGFVLNVYTKAGTSHLIVDVSLPYESNAAVMNLVKASVLYRGKNIPCVGVLVPNYENSEDNTYVDYIQFDFGRITNLARNNDEHVDPDLLQIHFSSEMLGDNPSVANGTNFTVQAGVRYELINKDVLWAAEIPVYAIDEQYHMYSEAEKQARFWLTNRAQDNILYNDTTVSFNLTVYIPPETTYTPLNINITAERGEDNRTLFSFCSLTLERLGSNFHLTDESMIAMTNYATDEGIVEQYFIDFDLVSNTMPADRAGDEANNYFVFEVHAHWLNHEPWLDNGTIVSAMVNVTYGPEGTWSDSMDYEISYDMPDLMPDDNEPEFNLYLDPTRTNNLKAGETAVYYLDTIVPPDSVAAYFVDVATPNETLSVCAVRLVSAGKNMPCFETDRVVNYWSDDEDYHRDRGYLEIGAVRNIGYEEEKSSQDDNLMLTQVVVKLEEAAIPPDNLTDPEQQEFYLTSRVGRSDMYTRAEAIDVDVQPPFTNLTVIPEVTFNKHTAEGRVTKGGGVVFDLDIYIPYDTIANYEVTFQSDVEDPYRTTICSARVISSGWNIPCINGSFLIPEFNSTTGDGHIDKGYLNAQDITNIEIENAQSPALMNEVNKVRVQLIARLEINDTHIYEGDTIWLGAAVKLNDFNEFILESSFNATEDPIFAETNFEPEFQIDCPNRNVSMTIGSTETYYIKITTPPMSTPMVLNITMPTSGDEAILTIREMDYFRVGENYACYDRLKLEPEYDSKFNTSQNTSAIVDLGVLTNHGTSHIYQYYPGKFEDNEMIIALEVQLADNYDLVDGSLVQFDVEFQYSLGRTHVITEEIAVIKTGDELPELEFNITMLNYDVWELHQTDNLKAMITVYHTNSSSAHAHAVFINFMIPYYIEIDEDVELEGPVFCVKTSSDGIKFHFEEMFFTDTFTMWFNFTLDPMRYMPMEWIFVNTTVPLEVVYYALREIDGNGSVVLGTAFKTDTELLDLTFTIEDCFDNLGLESGYIDDCQIKSSSSYNESYGPQYGRLNDIVGWAPPIRDYPPYAGNEYFEVTFGGMFRFSGIKMQVGPANESFVSSFRVSYTDDGYIWDEYMEGGAIKIFVNDYYANGTEYNATIEDPWVLHMLQSAFNARAVRILPVTYNNTDNSTAIPVVRFELMGCQRDVEVAPSQEFCESDDTLPDYGYYERGFLVEPISGSVYVCILEYIDGPTRCSFSRDNGTTWESIDNNVANILAIHHNDIDLELFGLSQNKKAIMRSDDLGVTWYSVYPDRYLNFLSTEPEYILEAVRVPFVSLPSKDPPPRFIMNTDVWKTGNRTFFEWGAAADGLFRREMTLEEALIYLQPTTEVPTTEDPATVYTTTEAAFTTEEVTADPVTIVDDFDSVIARNVTYRYPTAWELIGCWNSVEY